MDQAIERGEEKNEHRIYGTVRVLHKRLMQPVDCVDRRGVSKKREWHKQESAICGGRRQYCEGHIVPPHAAQKQQRRFCLKPETRSMGTLVPTSQSHVG